MTLLPRLELVEMQISECHSRISGSVSRKLPVTKVISAKMHKIWEPLLQRLINDRNTGYNLLTGEKIIIIIGEEAVKNG